MSSPKWMCLRVLCLTIFLASRIDQVVCGAGLTVTPSPGLISSSVGSVVTLRCVASHSPSICLWRTPYQAIYTVGGGRVWEEGRLTSSLLATSHTCGLTIDKLEARDGGVWQCEVGSVVNGDFTTTTASTTITVSESVEQDTSLVLLRLLGEETVLPCSIDSSRSPVPRSIDASSEKMCRWTTPYNRTYSLKDDEYEERGRLQRSRSENCNLRVASLQSRDQGRWVCHVGHSGSHNLQEKPIILKLESPLKLSAPTSILQHADERATLVCHANKEYDNCEWTTPYQVTYQFDNNHHRSHEQGRLQYFGFSSMDCGIVIRGLGTRDSGGWTCRVQATVQGKTSNSTDIVRLFVEPKKFEEVPLSEEFGSDYDLDYKTTEYDAFDYVNGDFGKVANKDSISDTALTTVSPIVIKQDEKFGDIVKDNNRVVNSGSSSRDRLNHQTTRFNPTSQREHDQNLPVFPASHQDSDKTTGLNPSELEFLERISGSRIDNRPIRIDGEEHFGSRQSNKPENRFQFGQTMVENKHNNGQVLQGNSNTRNKHRKQDQVRRVHDLINSDKNLRTSSKDNSHETQNRHTETSSNGQFANNDNLNTKTEERRLLQMEREQHHFQELQRRREEAKQKDELRRLRELEEKRNKEKEQKREEERQREIEHKKNILLEEQRRKALEDQRQRDLEEKRQLELQERRQQERKALEEQRQRDLEEKRQKELQERRQQERKALEEKRQRDLEEKRQLELKERRQQEIKNRRQKEIEEKRQKDILQMRQKQIEEKRQRDIEERRLKEIEEKRLKEIEEKRLKEIEERRLKEIEEKRLKEIEERQLKEIEERRLKEIEERRLKEIEEKRLKEIEERRLKERRLKEIQDRRLKEIQERRLKEIEENRAKRIKERKQIQEDRLKILEENKELEERRLRKNTKRRKQQNDEKQKKDIEEKRLKEIEQRKQLELEEKRKDAEEKLQLEKIRKAEEEKIAEEKRQKEISEKIKEEKRQHLIEQRLEQHMQKEVQRKEQERLSFLLRLEEEKNKEKKRKAEEERKLELAKRLEQEKNKFEDRRRERIRQEAFEKKIEVERQKVRSRLKEEDKKEFDNRRVRPKTVRQGDQTKDQENTDSLARIKEVQNKEFKEEQIRLKKLEESLNNQADRREESFKNQREQADRREESFKNQREQLKLEREKLEKQQEELRRQQELLELSKKQQQEKESSQQQNNPIEKECVISPWPEAGNVTCPSGFLSRGRYTVPHGNLCSLECQPGFVSLQRRTATCSSGSWDAVLQCVRPGAMLVVGGRSDTYGVLSSVELLTSGGVCRGAVPPIPAMRWKMVAATLDGDSVLVCGGINFLGDPKTTCWVLQLQPDPGSQEDFTPSWQEMEGLLVPRDAAAWAAEEGKLFVMGGSLGTLSGYTASVEVWDGSRWSVGPSLSSSRASHCAVGLGNGSIIVTGGYGALRAVQRLDIQSRTWTDLPSLNPLRAQHGCALVELDGRRGIMVAGGDSGGTRLNDVRFLALDPAATWTRLADLNTARWGRPSIGVIGGRITVVGGWDGVKALSSVEYYDEPSETWKTSRLTRLSTERRWAAATQINTKLFPKCVSKRQ